MHLWKSFMIADRSASGRAVRRALQLALLLAVSATAVTSCDDADAPLSPDSFDLDAIPDRVQVFVGQTVDIVASVQDRSGQLSFDRDEVASSILWTSRTPSIATVVNGVITGETPGTTVIMGTYQGLSEEVTVRVMARPEVATSSLPGGTVGSAYSVVLDATGGDGSYTWAITSGRLPQGLSLSASGGIVGTPAEAGTFDLTLQVETSGETASQQLSVAVVYPPPTIQTASLPNGVFGATYTGILQAGGGDGSFSWALTAGALPDGLTLEASTGVIGGTPTAVGTFEFTVEATSAGQTDSRALSISVGYPAPTITTTSLPAATVDAEYSQTLQAADGDGTFAWTITSGNLPEGLTLSSATGLISGTPTAAGTSSFTVEVSSAGQTASRALSISVGYPAPTITTASLPNAILDAAYSETLQAVDGDGTYSWAVISGNLPNGLTLTGSTGVISGTPTTPGTFEFTVEANSADQTATRDLSIAVTYPPPAITTEVLSEGVIGTAYTETLEADGGDGTYTWAVIAGALPDGLTLDGETGVVSGTPGTVGTFDFTVEVTSGDLTDTRQFSLGIDYTPAAITTTTLSGGEVGTAYNRTLQASGGDGTFVWAVAAGSLPDGLSLGSSTGVISGIPTTPGTFDFTVRVTSAGQTDARSLSITIVPELTSPTITTTSLPDGEVGTAYSQSVQATGGESDFTWSLASGNLPTGLSLATAAGVGVISGTPQAAGIFSFTLRAESGGESDTQAFTVTILAQSDPPTITTTSLPDGEVGTPYSETLEASGGGGSLSWSIVSGSLPDGLSLGAGTGLISGTPTVEGSFNFTVRVSSGGETDSRTLSITTTDQLSPPTIVTTSMPDGDVGVSYVHGVQATGGDGSYSWSVVSGSLPDGLTLRSGTGVIRGTPTAGGTFGFTVQVTSAGLTDTQALSITIQTAPLAVTTGSLSSGVVGSSYSQTLQASGGDGSYSWSVVSGSLPTGLSLNSGSGVISGTPSTSGTSNFTVQVASNGQTATKALFITITTSSFTLTITTTSLPSGVVGAPYSATVSATGGGGSFTWSVVNGSLPAGLSLDVSTGGTGIISGTPEMTGVSNFRIRVASGGQTAARDFSINVVPAPSITTASLPDGEVQTPYSATLQATGGDGNYAWAVVGGNLPAGLTLNSGSGVISGTPTVFGTFNLTFEVTSAGQTDVRDLAVTIRPTAPTITTTSLGVATVGTLYSQTLQATGGDGTFSWTVTSGSLPDGLALAAATGTIGGTPTVQGNFNFTVRVTSAGQTDTQALSIFVDAEGTARVEGGPNEPAGFVPVVGREFNSKAAAKNDEGVGSFPWKTTGGEGWDDHEYLERLLTLRTDATSPLSPPNVMRFEYPAQTVPDGTSFTPGQAQTQNFQNPGSGLGAPLALQEIYNRWTFKVGPNFQVNDNSGYTKIVFYRGFYDGRLVNGPYIKFGRGSGGKFTLNWDLQGTEDNARILEPTGNNEFSTDTWYEVEVLLRMNTAPGVRDGEVHTWIKEHPSGNRIKVFEYTDVLLRDVQDVNSNGYFSSVRHDPVWGGQGGTISPTFYWWLGHSWVSGRE